MTADKLPQVRGHRIRTDKNGLVCISDIWLLADQRFTRRPSKWRRLPSTKALMSALARRIGRKSTNSNKVEEETYFYAKSGKTGGSYVHPVLALAYAEYLSPDIGVDVRDVFLRYRAADATLADEILGRATPEANEWAGLRALSRSQRRQFTDVLKAHGVNGSGYGQITNAVYLALFDKVANDIRADKGIQKSVALRDAMKADELSYIMASENLASERISEEVCVGNSECRTATKRSASFIRKAIEADRADRRQRRLV